MMKMQRIQRTHPEQPEDRMRRAATRRFSRVSRAGWVLALIGGMAALLLLFSAVPSGMLAAQQVGTSTARPTLDPIFTFDIAGEIGRALPRRIVYDPVGEQYAIVDAYNALSLSDATTYRTRFTLLNSSEISDLAFSHDGRYLAAINGINVELWDTQSGQLTARLDAPGSPRRLFGPLTFSSEDQVLVFYGEYPAPRALRRSENDRVTYPWVWHLPAARGEGASTLPEGVQAQVLYDYLNGFVLTPDDRIIAALPSRLRVLNALTLATEYEIPTDRYEQDALTIYTSLRDSRVYVFSGGTDTLLYVDVRAQTLSEIPLNAELSARARSGLPASENAVELGGGLLRYLLLDDADERFARLSSADLILIDLLQPPTSAQGVGGALPLLYYEDEGVGRFTFARSDAGSQFVLSPNGESLAVRRFDDLQGEEYIIQFALPAGRETGRYLPALRSVGGYDRNAQNRVLAYDASGEQLLSDFERLDADTFRVMAEDLRYSFQFSRFFFGRDPGTVVTIAGSEWRVWDIATNTVLRREVIERADFIRATSPDGYRILTDTGTDLGVQDFGTGEFYLLGVPPLPGGSSLQAAATIPNPGWTRLLVAYEDNPSGPYTPGGALSVVDAENNVAWFMAGDDLPAPLGAYGWVDDETVYVTGGTSGQARIFGAGYAPDGLPQCLADAFPESTDEFRWRWGRLLLLVRPDRLNALALRLCDDLPATAADAAATLAPTRTPDFRQPTRDPNAPTVAVSPTPTLAATLLPPGEIPACLLQRFPDEIAAYTALWQELSSGLADAQVQELAVLLCEGIGPIATADPAIPATALPGGAFTGAEAGVMFINAETGERGVGGYTPPIPTRDPLPPIRTIYEQYFERTLATGLLNDSRDQLAVSNLPGELTIYQLDFTYERAGVPLTATAQIVRTEQNLVYAELSPAPTRTPEAIASARPTLTITPSQTVLPRPVEDVLPTAEPGQGGELCPFRDLIPVADAPADYDASGRIYAYFSDGPVWRVEPEDGTRSEDPDAPPCGRGLNCQFSPDGAWILAQTYELVYVVRPDNSDQRVLWDLRTPNPPTPFPRNLVWSGRDTLQWDGPFPVGGTPDPAALDATPPAYINGVIRDTLNVFPDPAPFVPNIRVDTLPARFISRQPGGTWAVVSLEYGTGQGYGYRYYLVNTATVPLVIPEAPDQRNPYYDAYTLDGSASLFAQDPANPISVAWSPYGDRLYFSFYNPVTNADDPYEVAFPEQVSQPARGSLQGEFSPDGRYQTLLQTTETGLPILRVQDVTTGVQTRYCLPNVSAIQLLLWSPDSRYLVVQALLTSDEEEHLLIISRETGATIDLTGGVAELITWGEEPGGYPAGAIATPTFMPTSQHTPSPTATVTPTATGG